MIEVHHLVQPVDGGTDEEENAIALCFDCHCWAGHYSAGHPKGSRYSVQELKLSRAALFEAVRTGEVQTANHEPFLDCKYLIFQEFAYASEYMAGNMDVLPFDYPTMLARNEVGAFQRSLMANGNRPDAITLAKFGGEDRYLAARKDARKIFDDEDGGDISPYYELTRPTTPEDIATARRLDRLTDHLVERGVSPEKLMSVTASGGCDSFAEDLLLSSVVLLHLLVRNITDSPLSVEIVDGRVTGDAVGDGIASMDQAAKCTHTATDGPLASIDPGSALVVPVATFVLPPLSNYIEGDGGSVLTTQRKRAYAEVYEEELNEILVDVGAGLRPAYLAGPVINPRSVEVVKAGTRTTEPVHQFDPTRTYSISQFLGIGCCPHLFGQRASRWTYLGEILQDGLRRSTESVVNVERFDEVAISELEDDYCCIEQLEFDGVRQTGHTIRRGQTLYLDVVGVKQLRVTGSYEALTDGTRSAASDRRASERRALHHLTFLSSKGGGSLDRSPVDHRRPTKHHSLQ